MAAGISEVAYSRDERDRERKTKMTRDPYQNRPGKQPDRADNCVTGHSHYALKVAAWFKMKVMKNPPN